jgi:hypothetical protein
VDEVSVAAALCWVVVAASSCAADDSWADEAAMWVPAERIWSASDASEATIPLNDSPSPRTSSGPRGRARTRRSPAATARAPVASSLTGATVRRANQIAAAMTSSDPMSPIARARSRCS